MGTRSPGATTADAEEQRSSAASPSSVAASRSTPLKPSALPLVSRRPRGHRVSGRPEPCCSRRTAGRMEPRYRMLETIREFGERAIAFAGEAAAPDAHAAYYLAWPSALLLPYSGRISWPGSSGWRSSATTFGRPSIGRSHRETSGRSSVRGALHGSGGYRAVMKVGADSISSVARAVRCPRCAGAAADRWGRFGEYPKRLGASRRAAGGRPGPRAELGDPSTLAWAPCLPWLVELGKASTNGRVRSGGGVGSTRICGEKIVACPILESSA